ncbi:MAG: cell wall metabolism sensor histidine kinase WalK [Candidatus Omnitrophica bacterium]|nr:cell wall metabolism sensor histidine kinase WalK [Candidatus Omnitrophota bacterium]MBU4478594.1 cell wall metabolism sensor histidine kinase WalK [Candidatus Omnitrophota bacterium]
MPAGSGFKRKLIFSFVLVISLSFGFIAFFLDKTLEENSLQDMRSSLLNQAVLIEHQIIPEKLNKADMDYFASLVHTLSNKIKCRITVIGPSGVVLSDSEETSEGGSAMENHAKRPEVQAALRGEPGQEIRYSSTLRTDMLYVAVPVKDNGNIVGVLRLAVPLTNVQRTLSAFKKTVFAGLLFALGMALILSSLITAQTVKPVQRVLQASRRFSAGDFSRRIIYTAGDEIGELGATLNKMAQEIEDRMKETAQQRQQLTAMFESMVEGIIVVDKQSNIVSANPAVEKIFGFRRENVQGRFFLEAIRNNDIAGIIMEVLEQGVSLSREIAILLLQRKIFQVNAAPISENNAVCGCVVVVHDISEMRRLETMRRDFIANASHELKTPLTSITGFVETLLNGALEDKKHNRDFLLIIQKHAQRLNNLVNDLLSLSHLESKSIVLEKGNYNLHRQMEEILSGFKVQIDKKALDVKNELPQSLMATVDREQIGHVFTNLIDNAVKFNKDNGFLKIYAEEEPDKIRITVENSGEGIPAKDIPRIFERFYRVDKARSHKLGGTGLGLSIVKHIVELHAGTVGVESTEGFGAKFWFTLPR